MYLWYKVEQCLSISLSVWSLRTRYLLNRLGFTLHLSWIETEKIMFTNKISDGRTYRRSNISNYRVASILDRLTYILNYKVASLQKKCDLEFWIGFSGSATTSASLIFETSSQSKFIVLSLYYNYSYFWIFLTTSSLYNYCMACSNIQ